MDLRSMLNDSTAHKPRLTPSHPTLEQTLHKPSVSDHPRLAHEQSQRDRPTPYPPPLQPPDQRSSGAGSYFPLQSPYQNNAASTPTLSAGAHSAHSQSPGTHGPPFTPRDVPPPHTPYNPSFVPSPSPLAPHLSTPSVLSYYQNYPPPSNPNAYPPGSIGQPSFSRQTSIPPNGTANPQPHHITPSAQLIPQPAAQLGSPAVFQRPSPQSQRPPSQGFEHYRTYSSGSISSVAGRDFGHVDITSPQHLRRESLQRQYSVEQELQRERERSISVSPKTIPRPSPYHRVSNESRRLSQVTPPIYHKIEADESVRQSLATIEAYVEPQQNTTTPPISSSETPKDIHLTPHSPSARPSPATAGSHMATPKSTNASLPAQPSPKIQKQSTLKRNASVVSGMSMPSQPPRKRPRRDEIPIFARSARPNMPPRLGRGSGMLTKVQVHQPTTVASSTNGILPTNGHIPKSLTSQQPVPRWEHSILNKIPYEDLTRRVCDWIVQEIGMAAPPADGAMFEIEAKIGEIYDPEEGGRIRLPIETEAIFNRDKWKRTKFESSMNMAQHKQLNEFLNNLVQESHAHSDRTPIFYDHPREADEFFELKPAGIANLPPSITQWLNHRHKPKVRRTMDLKTNKIKAQIIKSRIADLEVYNPGADFDYRISISIESPWKGDPEWLDELRDVGQGRSKDRVSYRHMAYQVDLTQVSYSGKVEKEHELEVEISTEQIRRELENLRMQRESKYEDLVRGFVDNGARSFTSSIGQTTGGLGGRNT